jgi:hypothetical protein
VAGLDSLTFEQDFEVARETLPHQLTKASEQHGRVACLAQALVQGQEVIPYSPIKSTYLDLANIWYGLTRRLGKIMSCLNLAMFLTLFLPTSCKYSLQEIVYYFWQ